MKRVLQAICALALIAVLMGCSFGTAATTKEEVPTTQVLASVNSAPHGSEAPAVDKASAEMAALKSVLAGLGLILVGCSGLFILERS